MTAAKFGAHACAAAFVLGLSLSSPMAGLAAADTPDNDPAPVASGSGAGESAPRSAERTKRPKRQAAAEAPVRKAADADSAAPTLRSAPAVRPDSASQPDSASPDSASQPGAASVSAAPRPAEANTVAQHAVASPSAALGVDPITALRAVSAAPKAPMRAGRPNVAAAATAPTAPAATASPGNAGCPACWGIGAPTIGQAINTVINHLFNSTFDLLSTLPGGPVANLLEGALVLLRRSLFLSPEGVTASQVGNSLTVSVNTGSVAYFRQDGTSLQVSGDPSFRRAKTFETGTGLTVEVANSPGNAGCAGVVLESGIVNGALETSQIDAIRFGPGAAFSGSVQSAVSGGTLVLRDAVRGLTGVVLDAPVVLANDVEVDGGNGDAVFLGIVDAAKAGQQSLTVTALGTTIFQAAVGGRTPLAGLLTRGIAPVDVPQSEDTRTIPLHFLPQFAPNGQAEVKYGIDVALGDNPSQVYEFDTGGDSFWAGYNPSLWNGVSLTPYAVTANYTSGNYYDGVVANTRVTLGQGDQTVSTAQPIGVAAILAGGNIKSGAVFDFTDPLVPPVEDRFFGDFGASFGTLTAAGLNTALTSPLFQLPGNLSSGFLVQLGPIGIDPQLTVGITDALRAQFPYAVPVAALTGGGNYPVSGYQVLQQFGFAPQYFAQEKGGKKVPIGTESFPQCSAQCLPTIIDSGAPSTGVRLEGKQGPYETPNGQLTPGVSFIAEFPTAQGRPPLEWTFVAGNTVSVDLVDYQNSSAAISTQNVNTGLNLYHYYDIMFDLQKQVIWLRPTGGQSTVLAGSVTTIGDQDYRQNATLNGTYSTGGGTFSVAGATALTGDTVVNAGSGDVTFSGTVDGPHALSVNSTGATQFVRQVGGQNLLASFATDAGGSTATASVLTAGAQTYGDPLTLNGGYAITNGSFSAAGDTRLAGPSSITILKSGGVTFGGRLDAQEGLGYSLTITADAGSPVRFNGDVGTVQPLGGLAVVSASTVTAAGTITLDGSVGFAAADGLSLGNGIKSDLTGGGQIRNFTGNGIVLTQPGRSQVEGFVISNNQGAGIQVIGSGDVSLSGNAVIANGGNGIEVKNSRNIEIVDTSITGNVGDGIRVTDSTDVEVSTNTINNNRKNGILTQGATTVGIGGNRINGNAGVGVSVGGQSVGNAILSNSIYANGGKDGVGIQLVADGNARQPAPRIDGIKLTGNTVDLTVTVKAPDDYTGRFTLQAFYTPPGAVTAPQGQELLYAEEDVDKGAERHLIFPVSGVVKDGVITVTATPESGPPNTSEFSNGVAVPNPS